MKEDPARVDAVSVDVDELGALARVRIDPSVYSQTAIFKTAYWYTDTCFLFLSRLKNGEIIEIEVRPKSKVRRDALVRLTREFCNCLIDQQVRQTVIAETGEIRDVLIRKAFFEGKMRLDPESLRSDESHVPDDDQSYKDDPLGIGRITGE